MFSASVQLRQKITPSGPGTPVKRAANSRQFSRMRPPASAPRWPARPGLPATFSITPLTARITSLGLG